MEPLSGVASVIAVIQLTGKIVEICGDYISKVKDAKKNIQDLQLELKSLTGVLKQLKKLLDGTNETKFVVSQDLFNDLARCSLTLTGLEKKIDPKIAQKPMRKWGFRALKWPLKRADLDDTLREIERYKSSFSLALQVDQTQNIDRIDQIISLKKLKIADGAAFDSYENQHDECLPGTRDGILRRIESWAGSTDGKCIFWLYGGAGTGKSTISRTIARHLKERKSLGASFFFKRGEEDRGNAKRLFSTLVQQLVLCIPELIPGIEKAIEDDPYISGKALGEQFNKLLLQPLLKVKTDQPTIAVIVIDALDECQPEDENEDIRIILQLLPRVQESKLVQLRFFLTSRPELPLRSDFKKIIEYHQDMDLHDIPESEIKHDISLLLKHKFSEIRERHKIPVDWPEEGDMQILIAKAIPLFISATTMCRFVGDRKWNPQQRLDTILRDETEYVSGMGSTYLSILNQFVLGQNEREHNQLILEFKQIISVIIILATPLSAYALSQLLSIDEADVNRRLDQLHSVLSVPDRKDVPVRILHLSFRDFLLDINTKVTRKSEQFWIDEKAAHQKVTDRCIDIMQDKLRKNICDLPSDGIQRNEIDMQTIASCLPSEIQYACRYWAQHLVQSQDPITEMVNIFSFLKLHFLHWVEAMSILGVISEVIRIVNKLQSIMQGNENPEILEFLHDAKRFILKNRQVADIAPLQLYSSGLAFAPNTSKVRNIFEEKKSNWLRQLPKIEKYWGAHILTLEGHSDLVRSVTFSPDGRLLASGSGDGTIKLWDFATGELRQTLEGHSNSVESVAFSPDGRLLASGSYDETVKLWHSATGELHQTLADHSISVESVAFSPDGRLLASGSGDGTIKLWDLATDTAELRQTLEGHSNSVESVAFSPDGQLLASGCEDGTVKLWNPTTGDLRQTLENYSSWIKSVAFSPDGRLLVFGSDDGTVMLWDVATGTAELRQTLKGHSNSVDSVVFSPDGRLLASGSSDRTVKLWDLATDTAKLRQTLKGHSNSVDSVVFSPDGRLLASGSVDRTVKLWHFATGTGELRQTLGGHSSPIKLVIFSPDGRLLVSNSEDGTVKLWNPTTGDLRQTLGNYSIWARSVVFSPDGRLLASGSSDRTVKLWDLATDTAKLRQTLKGHSGLVESVAFSPDGRLLASGSYDKTVKLWDPATGELRQTLKGHSSLVESVAFSLDGRLLASGSVDRTIKLWHSATGTGELRQALESHSDSVWPENNASVSLLENQWVCYQNERKLWLPVEYRPLDMEMKGGILALGSRSGRVIFISCSFG